MKNLNLIATLPNLSNLKVIRSILSNPNISSARFNTGVNTLMTPLETVKALKELQETYKKIIWLDIKGRQLRIDSWADASYEAITLNHNIDLVYPAQIHFRNGSVSNIVRTRGNQILVDEPPKKAVGKGQSVNIIAKDLEILGYLTNMDTEYLKVSKDLEMDYIMASFVENYDDLSEILKLNQNAKIISKIESLKGVEFISTNPISGLMAARDDLYVECKKSPKILDYLKLIVDIDKNAICASKIFSSLENQEFIDLADYSDIYLMYELGYRNFMLCDNICNYHFDKAINAWERLVRKI